MPLGSVDYAQFFLASPPDIVELECLELFHTNFTQEFRICRNCDINSTIQVTQTAGFFTGDRVYTYYPVSVDRANSTTDLDQNITLTFGDLGTLLPAQMDSVSAEAGFNKKPILVYRTYRSDDLTQELFGPLTLEVRSISFNRSGCVIEAKAPLANKSRSGEIYTRNRFPMLEGIIR